MNIDIDRLDSLTDSVPLPDDQFRGLPVFAVGGAVRDTVRGVEPNDIDLMVAETTADEMRERGFREIDSPNNDTFAVFQDDRGREVAIAREEESTGEAHRDFEVTPVPADVEASEAVQRDLKRRDLTINAMAFDLRWGVLFDPHGGADDLREQRIRHVSDAFRDDPLRILRAARFAARLDFEIANETLREMHDFAEHLTDLPSERIRIEIEKNFRQAQSPRKFFDVLNDIDALWHTSPTLWLLTLVPAGPEEWHKEGSVFEHTMLVLEEMHDIQGNDELSLWMALTHDFGKAATQPKEWPAHHGHGENGIRPISKMADKLSMSNRQVKACKRGARHHMRLKNPSELRTATLFDTWCELKEDRHRLIRLMVADARGRIPSTEFNHLVLEDAFQRATDAVATISGHDLMDEGYDPDADGEKFGEILRQRRIEAMREMT